jgi:hypothetical protein
VQAILDLTPKPNLIFIGTVIRRNASSVPGLSAKEYLIVVRVDRGLRVDPGLGDLKDKLITIAVRKPESFDVGQEAIFFTTSWIYGGGIAVREVDHLDASEEHRVAVAAVVADLPLLERLRSAELVVEAEVLRVGTAEREIQERDAALWAPAHLRVTRTLLGKPRKPTVLYFPTSERGEWMLAPRFHEHQRGVFILHLLREDEDDGPTVPEGGLVALDPSDFQADSQHVENLLAHYRIRKVTQ